MDEQPVIVAGVDLITAATAVELRLIETGGRA